MKFFTLPTCKTCQRIDADLQPAACGAEIRDIKASGVKAEEVDAMKAHAGSYEALFSRRAMKFRSMGLADMDLGEDDYRRLIIEEYNNPDWSPEPGQRSGYGSTKKGPGR